MHVLMSQSSQQEVDGLCMDNSHFVAGLKYHGVAKA